MLSVVRVTFTFSLNAYRLDYTNIGQVVVTSIVVLLIITAKRFITNNNIALANEMWMAVVVLAGISTSLLVLQNLWWINNIDQLRKFTSSGLLVFYIYYLVNNVFGIIRLLKIRAELKHFRIHSKNLSLVTNALFFWIFLLVTYSLHIIILS